eukprot:760701-Hanusia_phi.AAC.1
MAEAMKEGHDSLDQDHSNYLRVWKFGDSEIHHLHSPSKDSSSAPSSDDSDTAGTSAACSLLPHPCSSAKHRKLLPDSARSHEEDGCRRAMERAALVTLLAGISGTPLRIASPAALSEPSAQVNSSPRACSSSTPCAASEVLCSQGSAAKSISFDEAGDRLGTSEEVVLPRTPGSAMRPALSPIPQEEDEEEEAEGRKQSEEGATALSPGAQAEHVGRRARQPQFNPRCCHPRGTQTEDGDLGHPGECRCGRAGAGLTGCQMRLSYLTQDTVSSSCKKKRPRQSQEVALSTDVNSETSGSVIERVLLLSTCLLLPHPSRQAKVRATAAQREELGTDFVLTPVRRSGRKKSGWSIDDATCIREELMTTGYAYQPNKALAMLEAFDNAKDSPAAEPQEAGPSPRPAQTPKRSARKKEAEALVPSPADPPRSTRRSSRAPTTPRKEETADSSIAKKRQQLKAKLAA